MQFAGRWVPIEVMNTVFILWLLAAAILVGLVLFINRRHVRSKRHKDRDRVTRRSQPRRKR